MEEIQVIDGGLAVDDRGTLAFVNSFAFERVKRFYKVENFSTSVIRAWHGHMKEGKYIYCVRGSAIFAAVALDSTTVPSKTAKVHRFVISSRKPNIVFVPPGHANGFRCLEEGTQVIFFSTASLEETKGDDYRFPVDYWGSEVWEVENR